MEEKFSDLVIQEIHTLGKNVARMDRKLDIKLDQVNRRIDENKICNSKGHDEIKGKLDVHQKEVTDRVEKKVDGTLFRWIIGGLVTGFIAIMITMSNANYETRSAFDKHKYFAEYIYYEITGQKWTDHNRESLLKARTQFETHMDELQTKKTIDIMPPPTKYYKIPDIDVR